MCLLDGALPCAEVSSSEPVRIVVFGNSFAARVQLPALRWAGANRVVGIAGADAKKAAATAERWG